MPFYRFIYLIISNYYQHSSIIFGISAFNARKPSGIPQGLVGHSKTFGMTGWRLGYACGPAEIVQAMTKVQQYSFVCAPSVVQYAALACPTVDA